jgi:hypothetical protein
MHRIIRQKKTNRISVVTGSKRKNRDNLKNIRSETSRQLRNSLGNPVIAMNHDFLRHLNSLSPLIEYTMEIQSDSAIVFHDVLVNRKEMPLTTKVYGKHRHTSRYLKFNSNHPLHAKK